jgi:hypothetical protein
MPSSADESLDILAALVLNATIAVQIMLYRPKEGAKTGNKQH